MFKKLSPVEKVATPIFIVFIVFVSIVGTKQVISEMHQGKTLHQIAVGQ